MVEIAQSLDAIIEQQLATGAAESESEAEKQIATALANRKLERKLQRAQRQVECGDYKILNDDFVNQFLARAKQRNKIDE